MFDYNIYVVGSYKEAENKGASAYIILSSNEKLIISKSVCTHARENTARVELLPVIEAMKVVPIGSSILVRSSSAYVVTVLGSGKTYQKNADLIDSFKSLKHEKRLAVRLEWVKRDGPNEWIKMCDKICHDGAHYGHNTKFEAPSVAEVSEYCKNNAPNVDAKRFVGYYERNGWKQKNGHKISDWHKVCREWDKRVWE